MEKTDWTEKVMDIFLEICRIPRPSGREEKMGQYLMDFASDRGLACRKDDAGNVLICKPATPGFENRQTVILQAHQDMVCEKDATLEHDFMTQPIDTYVEDGWLKARGTTLGADDGMGIAMALAVLDSSELQHGPVECLFTTSEETGLCGAMGLKAGMMNGRMLINLDSEDEGEIFIGCAGGINTTVTFDFKSDAVPAGFLFLKVGVDKLHGGHSGDDIDKGYANANKILARFLNGALDKYDLRLCSISGGNLHNAIPRDATAVIAVPFADREKIRIDFNVFAAEIQDEYHVTESSARFFMESVDPVATCIEPAVAANIIRSVYAVFNGVYAMSMDVPGLVETSSNLARIRTEEGKVTMVASQRSSVESAKYAVQSTLAACFRMAGAKVESNEGYPGWAPNPKSQLLDISVRTYRELFGKEPKVKAIHAGLECGLFLTSYPDLDMISVGPTLRGVHSPSERLELATVPMVFEHLLAILRQIP
ncbi:MAG: aminoacyl-histidine dipeptidase [Bacteroidetes bacterium]|nr:aminoacyl-histidine dipeptidase [Candidatus Colenecus caballi]